MLSVVLQRRQRQCFTLWVFKNKKIFKYLDFARYKNMVVCISLYLNVLIWGAKLSLVGLLKLFRWFSWKSVSVSDAYREKCFLHLCEDFFLVKFGFKYQSSFHLFVFLSVFWNSLVTFELHDGEDWASHACWSLASADPNLRGPSCLGQPVFSGTLPSAPPAQQHLQLRVWKKTSSMTLFNFTSCSWCLRVAVTLLKP